MLTLWVSLLAVFGLIWIFWGAISGWVDSRAEADVAKDRLAAVLKDTQNQKELNEKLHETEILVDSLPPSAHRERLRQRIKAREIVRSLPHADTE